MDSAVHVLCRPDKLPKAMVITILSAGCGSHDHIMVPGMSAKESAPKIALPKGWSDNIKSAVLHVISLAQFGTAYTRGWAANSIHSHIRLQAECERLEQQVAQLTEEIRIKDARMGQLDPRNRPHYPATERIAILLLRASHGWSLKQTAKRFLVTPATIASWVKRVDEQRPKALVQLREPVNKFPDFVRYAVQRLKAARPSMGKVKIVQMLCRAGLARYVEWYNEWRPHTFLRGRTPNEAYHRRHPACRYPRFEPRSRWPRGAPCAAPRVPARGKSGVRLNLDVAYHAEQRHLPIVKLRRVA